MAKHKEYLWKDPFDPGSWGAVLLSDQIHFLADEVGLIEPFDEKRLRPAAYDLCVGDSYYVNDVRVDFTHEMNEIEIPPNGLVYIKTKEKFNVPYYLVARYSLRVHQVYRGLLIDNGLHVDPGYCGYIWIPLHNFTMQSRILRRGEEFISVEFNRTTRLPSVVNAIHSEDELISRGIGNELRGSHDRAIKVFYKTLERYQKRHEELTPRSFWVPGERHKSGTLATDQRMMRLQRIGWLALAGLFVTTLLTILAILLPIVYGEFGRNRDGVMQNGAEIRDLHDQLQQLKNRLDAVVASQAAGNPPTRQAQQKGK